MATWLLSLIILLIPLSSFAATPAVVITEIAAALPSDQEWIEIYNTTNQTIDITDWRFVEGVTPSDPDGTRHSLKSIRGDLSLNAGEYAVIANSADDFLSIYKGHEGTLIDSSWSSLKEEGELLWLEDSTGAVIEKFTYIPVTEGVLARRDAYATDYTSLNWAELAGTGTPGRKNETDNSSVPPPVSTSPAPTAAIPSPAETPATAPAAGENKETEPFVPVPINEPPTARAGEDRSAYPGETVSFDGGGSFDTEGTALSYRWDFGDGTRGEGKVAAHQFAKEGDYIVRLTVSDGVFDDEDKARVAVLEEEVAQPADDTDNGVIPPAPSQVPSNNSGKDSGAKIYGIVLVEPGILAKTWFYIRASDGSPTQVYSSKGEFQKARIGQEVEVKGEMSAYKGIARVKISAPEDMRIVAAGDPPLPVAIVLNRINEAPLGELVSVEGEIVKEEGNIFIAARAGERLRVEIKDAAGIDKGVLAEGAQVTLAGILDKTQTGFRLQPRHAGDVIVTQPAVKQSKKDTAEAEVLGEKTKESQTLLDELSFESVGDAVNIPPSADNKRVVYKYLIVTAAALLIVFVGLRIRQWRKA